MIKVCLTCDKRFTEDLEECIFCYSKLEEKKILSGEISSFTQVNVPSKKHPYTPYYCALAKDEQGYFFVKKLDSIPENNFISTAKKLNLNLSIIGAGAMGLSLTKLALNNGFKVTLLSRNQEKINHLKLNNPNLTLTADYEDLKRSQIVIETVKENLKIKREVFSKLNQICQPDTLLLTNTSSLQIKDISENISHPERIAGFHLSNPADKMLMAEIIKTKQTSNQTISTLKSLAENLGKKPVLADDTPGFIVNRIIFPSLIEAVKLFEQGVPKEDIRTLIRTGYNYPLGPLEIIDFMGLDVFQDILTNLYKSTQDEKFKIPSIISQLVQENKLGRKTKQGFYDYK